MSRRSNRPGHRPIGPALKDLAEQYRAAIEAARTWGELAEIRADIRRRLSPSEIDCTDLWGVCEQKRLSFKGQDGADPFGPDLF